MFLAKGVFFKYIHRRGRYSIIGIISCLYVTACQPVIRPLLFTVHGLISLPFCLSCVNFILSLGSPADLLPDPL
ncbi:hypothetical protein F9C07_1489175 [Aspergillus flavus]|uniref:Uncharacterized protein n=1 Tax=Aspergillus flavus (strain ATCC 200026 / FGSC A1120 / IAM 13836 / NRRL 3357 / JCM 12722 / SRRC 167) TaxID=332952 RepID=A0A7U2MT72_ASPFN|nr:hypothetical protein F9C07_1489175 [Aspergillus flavus]